MENQCTLRFVHFGVDCHLKDYYSHVFRLMAGDLGTNRRHSNKVQQRKKRLNQRNLKRSSAVRVAHSCLCEDQDIHFHTFRIRLNIMLLFVLCRKSSSLPMSLMVIYFNFRPSRILSNNFLFPSFSHLSSHSLYRLRCFLNGGLSV